MLNRTDKIKLLQSTLDGSSGGIRQLQTQRKKDAMPYIDVYGIINIHQCHPLFLNVEVVPTESIVNGIKGDYLPLHECLARFDGTEWKKPYYSYSAAGSIEADNSQFDDIVLDYIHIRLKDYSNTYYQKQTVADLKRYFYQSASSLEQSFIVLSFDSDLSKYTRIFDKRDA